MMICDRVSQKPENGQGPLCGSAFFRYHFGAAADSLLQFASWRALVGPWLKGCAKADDVYVASQHLLKVTSPLISTRELCQQLWKHTSLSHVGGATFLASVACATNSNSGNLCWSINFKLLFAERRGRQCAGRRFMMQQHPPYPSFPTRPRLAFVCIVTARRRKMHEGDDGICKSEPKVDKAALQWGFFFIQIVMPHRQTWEYDVRRPTHECWRNCQVLP